MTAHVHAASMMDYAKDAAETSEPWLRWQFYDTLSLSPGWKDLKTTPEWHVCTKYRRKPQTITINGVDVPKPVYRDSQMKSGSNYWMPSIASEAGLVTRAVWYGRKTDMTRLDRGLVHTGHEAARQHALALLSLTMIEAEDNDDDPDPQSLISKADEHGVASGPVMMRKTYMVNPSANAWQTGPALPILERVEVPMVNSLDGGPFDKVEALVKVWYYPGDAPKVYGPVDAIQGSVRVVLRCKGGSVALPEHFARAVEVRWQDIARQIIDEHQKTAPFIQDSHADLFGK